MQSNEMSEVTVQCRAKELALIQSNWRTSGGPRVLMFAKALQIEDNIEGLLKQADVEYQKQRELDPEFRREWLHRRWREELYEQIVGSIRGLERVPSGKSAVCLAEATALAGVMEGLTKTQMKELYANVETLATRILPPGNTPKQQLMFLKPKLYRAVSRHKGLAPCKDALVACLDLLEGQDFSDEGIRSFAQFVQAIREFFEFYEDVNP